jgi:hypothetical protein
MSETANEAQVLPGEDVTVPVAEETRVITESRVPGDAVVTQADADALAAVAAEPRRRAGHLRGPDLVVPTHAPAANAAARPNIVGDGPGTVGEVH